MKKKIFLIFAFCCCMLLMSACSDTGDGTPAEPSASQAENTEPEKESIPFSNSVGVWTYSDDIIFHSSDGNRYMLKEDSSGIVQDKEGKKYTIQDCDYKLIAIINITEDTMNVKEGKFSEAYVGSHDYPDGYKTMMMAYQKSDLFDIDALEAAVKGETPAAETEEETIAETTETATAETETETSAPETTETETVAVETETSADTEAETSGQAEIPEDAEYAAIYKKIEDFLETDNYKQKDPGNRSLEIFNYLHNLADSNIEESSITNDTAKNEVSFKCYEKYIITINNTEGTVTVTEN